MMESKWQVFKDLVYIAIAWGGLAWIVFWASTEDIIHFLLVVLAACVLDFALLRPIRNRK